MEAGLRQAGALVVTPPRPGTGHLAGRQAQPVGVHPLLGLEVALETSVQVRQREPTDGAAEEGVGWRGEDAVENLIV